MVNDVNIIGRVLIIELAITSSVDGAVVRYSHLFIFFHNLHQFNFLIMEYNTQQQNALVNNLHQVLIANAGSGKTAVLVEKFYRLINEREGEDIQRIVAITFTRKAASEMKERIVRKINEHIEFLSANDKNDFYFKLILLRERISIAKLQTIHSFCQEILSEYAVNIGYNPNLSVIEDYQFQKIYLDFYNDTLEDVMEFDENYKFIFETIPEKKFNEIVKMLVDNNLLLRKVESFYNQSNEKLVEELLDSYIKIVRDFFDQQREALTKNTNLFSDKNQSRVDSLHNLLSRLTDLLSSKDITAINTSIKELKEIKHKGNSKYLKAVLSNINYKFLKDLNKELDDLSNSSYHSRFVVFFDLMRNIINFAHNLYQKIEHYKKRNSLVTYNDMIYKVLELFQDEEIVNKVSEKYDYFLIDEFQDTDANQFQIFQKLAFSSNNHKFLFLVGDPKQSIYGFRNADVRVINHAKKLLENKNNELIQFPHLNTDAAHHSIIESQNFGSLELSNSYRLNVANAAFVNHIFSKIMTNNKVTGFEVDYNPLTYARENPFLTKATYQLSPNLSGLHQFGGIKILNTILQPNQATSQNEMENQEQNEINEDTPQQEKEIDSIEEARSVSDYIKYLINNKTKIYEPKLKTTRSLTFADIAILVRKNSLINNLVKALDGNNIPFTLTGAEDFFETQEIIDIISFLKFLNNPDDNYYFVATLKSYFFNLDDQTIYDIISPQIMTGKSYWDIFNDYATNNSLDNQKLKRATSIMKDILTKKDFYTVYDLVTFILRTTNYEEFFANFSSKNIIYKNIDKFRSLVNRICSSGTNSIGELLFELELVQQSADFSSEVEISSENAVNILTMHKAKGLEFPVVVIYQANFTTNNQMRLDFYDDKFPNFNYNIITDTERKEVSTPLIAFLNKRQQIINEEEDKRLFYVAATRAKDLLIISSFLKPDLKGNYAKSMKYGFGPFFFSIIYKSNNENEQPKFTLDFKNIINFQEIEHTDVHSEVNVFVEIEESLKISLNGEPERLQTFSIPIEVFHNFSYPKKLEYIEEQKVFDPIVLIDKVPFPRQEQYLSATKIQLFEKDKNQYFLKYGTDFNLDYLDLLQDKHLDLKSNIQGKVRGTIIHETIANISNWHSTTEIYQEKLRNEIIKHSRTIYDNNIIDEIQEEITRVFTQDFIKNRIDLILKSKFELPFFYFWEGRYFDLVFDVLFKDENGIYEIWDWKNNIINNETDYLNAVDYYSLQMKIYSLILSKQEPEQGSYTSRLFFTRLAGKQDIWMKVFKWTKEELNEFEKELMQISDKLFDIKSINFD